MIRVDKISHRIGDTQALRDVSLELPRGGLTALIGPNGAGKSTLLSLIARLQPIQAGKITVDELQVGACSDRALARRLAVMTQSAHVAARLRVRELVGFGRHPWHAGRMRPEDHAAVDASLTRFGLHPLAGRFLDQLSGGQRQRAFAAMAHAQGTDYLLLDEPLNNLDLAAARALMGVARQLADEGRTVLVVLHDVNTAAAWADRIIAMKDGRIAADGTPAQIVNTPVLREVFGVEVAVGEVAGRPVALV